MCKDNKNIHYSYYRYFTKNKTYIYNLIIKKIIYKVR